MRSIHIVTGVTLVAAVLAAVVLLSSPYRFTDVAAATRAAPSPTSPRVPSAPRLLGADGTPQPAVPGAVPTDPLARTRVALYATRDQALALGAELDGAVIWLDADDCDEGASSSAIDAVERFRADRHLGLDAPVFITGRNLQAAAQVVDRLSDDGYQQVFLVTR